MDHTHPYGKSISILKFSDSKEVIIDNRELDKIFNHPDIQDRKVVILSLIGAFRGGKSFFLDYCLRFLYANFPSINNRKKFSQSYFTKNENWMSGPDEPLKGFSWRPGIQRETIGIDFWSDVFLHTMEKTGEKIAIFVMDTQGLFDNQSTPTDNTRIFALGTLISSIQVLNLKQQIQEDQLQYLQFATGFAQFNAKKNGRKDEKPFQNLTFLIRDWENYEEYAFGADGGRKYLDNVIESTSTQKDELRSVRDFIKKSFEKLDCCLLPHPGMKITGRRSYDGSWSEMDSSFKNELKNVIEYLLLPEHLTLKKINSQNIIAKDMKGYIETYLKLFQSGDIPETQTLYQSMLESNMGNLIKKCIEQYITGVNNDNGLKNEESIPLIHNKWKTMAIKTYDDATKMGNKSQELTYRAELDQKLEGYYKEFKNVHGQRFRELRRKEAEYQAKLEEERRRKEIAELERRQKEIQLKEAQARMDRERREAHEQKRLYEEKMREIQEMRERERQEELKRKEEEARRRWEQAERDRRQKEAEFKEAQERKKRERKEAEERKEREEQRWKEYQEQQAREHRALQERLEEEERRRKESENSFGNNLWKGIKGVGLVAAAPFVVVGGGIATGAAAIAGAIEGGPDRANELANECAEDIFGGYGRAFQNL